MRTDIVRRAYEAFRNDADAPPLTLRGANEVDGYACPEPYDGALDGPTDEYIESYAYWGVIYLDARSWRHYLPRLIDYATRHPEDPRMAAEALVRSLRPPDRYPPRLATLDVAQESVVREFLEAVAVGGLVPHLEEEARQALEEWWRPNPRRRPSEREIAAARAQPVSYRGIVTEWFRLAVPDSLSASGMRHVREERRHAGTWGGYVHFDAYMTVAVNVTELADRGLTASAEARRALFTNDVRPLAAVVPGARAACRLEGTTSGDSPADAQSLTVILAASRCDLVTVSIRTWPRDDVSAVVARITASLELVPSRRE
jgi:hypothetical protein